MCISQQLTFENTVSEQVMMLLRKSVGFHVLSSCSFMYFVHSVKYVVTDIVARENR